MKPLGSLVEAEAAAGAREDATLGEALAVLDPMAAVEVRPADGEVMVPRAEPAMEAEEPA